MKINKSRTDCQSLITHAAAVDKAYAEMETVVRKGSGNPDEKAADLAWIARQRAVAAKAIGWWKSDIVRIDEAAAKAVPAKADATAVPAKK